MYSKLAQWIKQNTFLGKNSLFTECQLEKMLKEDQEMFEYFMELYKDGVKNG